MTVPFYVYGFTTNDPPPLHTVWNEQKRPINLRGFCYVFITELYGTPWQLRNRFPNADRSTIKYYWCKWADRRVKRSLHWLPSQQRNFGGTGVETSKVFGQR